MMFVPLRCHNLILSVDAPQLEDIVKIPDFVEFEEDVKIWIIFGQERGKVTIRISCDAGMDKRTVLFAVHRAYDLVNRLSPVVVVDVAVKTFELNKDYHGVRIDPKSPQCYTRKGFDEFIERVYQKEESLLRAEVKITREMKIDEVLQMMRGGVEGIENVQSVFELSRSFDKMVLAMKVLIERQDKMMKIQEAMMNTFVKMKEQAEKGEPFRV